MARRHRLLVLAVGVTALLAGVAVAATTVLVTPVNLAGFKKQNEACAGVKTGKIKFVSGPGTPPTGTGSVRFRVGSNGDSYPNLRTGDYAFVRLTSLTALLYSTYVSHFGSGGQAPYIDLYIDNNNNGTRDDILTFEPIYQTGQQPLLNTWQTWDALNGLWWSDGMGGPPPLLTLGDYVALHPDASIVNSGGKGLILAAGCGGAAWTGFVGYLDRLHTGVTGREPLIYDFETG